MLVSSTTRPGLDVFDSLTIVYCRLIVAVTVTTLPLSVTAKVQIVTPILETTGGRGSWEIARRCVRRLCVCVLFYGYRTRPKFLKMMLVLDEDLLSRIH